MSSVWNGRVGNTGRHRLRQIAEFSKKPVGFQQSFPIPLSAFDMWLEEAVMSALIAMQFASIPKPSGIQTKSFGVGV